jgi:hypothetical protein
MTAMRAELTFLVGDKSEPNLIALPNFPRRSSHCSSALV